MVGRENWNVPLLDLKTHFIKVLKHTLFGFFIFFFTALFFQGFFRFFFNCLFCIFSLGHNLPLLFWLIK